MKFIEYLFNKSSQPEKTDETKDQLSRGLLESKLFLLR
jgi:hypothetical protein